MSTHDDHDFEMGGAAGEERGSGDRTQREQGATDDERSGRRDERSGGCGHRDRHRRRRRHRHHGRKERVLHTRVSEQLSDDIRRLADDLRVPASNLVRNVLEEVFTVVESVSDDMGDLFEDLLEEADAARDRLRERERGGRRRRHRTRTRTRGGARRESDGDVEDELRADERREWETGEVAHGDRATSGGTGTGTDGDTRDGDAIDDTDHARDAEPAGSRPDAEQAFPDVLGWQPLVLNHESTCARCGVTLARGRRAFLGLTANGLSGVTLCRACVGA